MSRGKNKNGSKVGRTERHKARQRALRERKRLRKARAAQYAHLPGQGSQGHREIEAEQPAPRPLPLSEREIRLRQESASAPKPPLRMDLEHMTVGRLREICKGHGIQTRSRDKKADLIAKIDAFMEGRS